MKMTKLRHTKAFQALTSWYIDKKTTGQN